MPNGDTNPNMVSLGRVFTEIRDMRKENKTEHKAITQELNKHSVQLACLETKWKFLKWLIPATVGVVGAVVGLLSLY